MSDNRDIVERLGDFDHYGNTASERFKMRMEALIEIKKLRDNSTEMKAHKVMTPEEYTAMPIVGWHEVCRDVDGFGGIGIRYLSRPTELSR